MGLEANLILSWLTLLVHLVRSVEPKTLINPQNITHLEIPELLFLWREVCNAVQPFLPISNSWAFADNRLLCFHGISEIQCHQKTGDSHPSFTPYSERIPVPFQYR